jgi:putative aldouronate transport system substrate-binding protein
MVLANSYNWPSEVIINAYRISSTNTVSDPHVPVKLLAVTPLLQTLTDKAIVLFCESIITRPENFDRVWDNGVRDWLVSGAQVIVDERRTRYREP